MEELIKKVSTSSYTSSKMWFDFTKDLKNYLENGDLDLYRINNVIPHIFTWPESSDPNMKILKN